MIKIVLFLCALGWVGSAGPSTTTRPGPHCLRAASLALQLAAPVARQLPPAGNPDHVEPAPGQNCGRSQQTPRDHLCGCHRECQQAAGYGDPNDPPTVYVQEDPQCRVYCYKSHCRCPIANCE